MNATICSNHNKLQMKVLTVHYWYLKKKITADSTLKFKKETKGEELQ